MSAKTRYVAVVGSGPAGFFAAEALLKRPDMHVDFFERLTAPFGLVRYGVAPDHQKIKQVIHNFAKTATHQRVRFFGNVTVGKDITAAQLAAMYDQVVYATGCEAPRRLGVPGEDLPGVHSALAFVSWYNAHPDYQNYSVDLDVSDVAVVGAGDVSMDVARLLLSTKEELAQTDMPAYALSEFEKKQIRRIHFFIRRGPAEASFAEKELRAVAGREHVKVVCELGLLNDALASELPNASRAKIASLLELSQQQKAARTELVFHFLSSPVEFIGTQKLARVKIEKNRLEERRGRTSAVGTGEFFEIECQLALLAVGYRGVPIDGLPFNDQSGLVPNDQGRVIASDGTAVPRQYVVGWLKRGPQGVIGTNKADSRATVALMLQELDHLPEKSAPDPSQLLQQRGVRFLTFKDWETLNQLELERGAGLGKPREKLVSIAEVLAALDRAC